jgi:hypothetical protein
VTTNTAYGICRSEYLIGHCKLNPLQIRKKTQTFIELLPSVRLWMAPSGYGGGYATSIPASATSPCHHHPPPYPPAGPEFHQTRPPVGTHDPTGTHEGAKLPTPLLALLLQVNQRSPSAWSQVRVPTSSGSMATMKRMTTCRCPQARPTALSVA